MYQVRTKGYSKRDPVKRWNLPERVFFACGACHILAYAFLERYGTPGRSAVWIKPDAGFVGNHIFVAADDWVFDYHGYAQRRHYLTHIWKGARRRWPGWDARLIELPADVLISEDKSRRYEGLWLREPKQFLCDAMPRARAFLDRYPMSANTWFRPMAWTT